MIMKDFICKVQQDLSLEEIPLNLNINFIYLGTPFSYKDSNNYYQITPKDHTNYFFLELFCFPSFPLKIAGSITFMSPLFHMVVEMVSVGSTAEGSR